MARRPTSRKTRTRVRKSTRRPATKPAEEKVQESSTTKAASGMTRPSAGMTRPTASAPSTISDRSTESRAGSAFDTYAKSFGVLSAAYPVLMFPVRIETRFTPPARPTCLKIRIFPDQALINDHETQLSESEQEIVGQYWRAVNEKGATEEKKRSAWQWLTDKVGPHRAPYVALKGRSLRKIAPSEDGSASTAGFLPDRWFVVGMNKGKVALEAYSGSVAKDLKFSPDISATQQNDLSSDPSISWMFDFDEAVEKGMALKVGLNSETRSGIEELFVLGICETDCSKAKLTPAKASTQLNDLLSAHLYSDGAGFVPQGMPTNNTEEVQTAWSALCPDTDGIWQREFGCDNSGLAAIPEELDIAGALLPTRTLPKDLVEEEKNYKVLEKALGFKRSVLKKFEFREGFEGRSMAAMNTLLWNVSIGEYLNSLMRKDTTQHLATETLNDAQDWFNQIVKGGAPLPAIRLGGTPYGILPVQCTQQLSPTNAFERELYGILTGFRDSWIINGEKKLVQLSENEQGDQPPGDRLLVLLSMQPNPVEFATSPLEDNYGSIHFAYAIYKAVLTDLKVSVLAQRIVADKNGKDVATYIKRVSNERNYQTITSQRGEWGVLKKLAEIQRKKSPALRTDLGNYIKYVGVMVDILEDHEQRSRALTALKIDHDFYSTVLTSKSVDPNIFFARYKSDESEYPCDRLVSLPGEEPVSPKTYLTWLKAYSSSKRVSRKNPGASPYNGESPLLFQLIKSSIDRTHENLTRSRDRLPRLTELETAITHLVDLPEDQLQLLLEQSLGLAGWRLDAWFSSLSSKRLEQLRSKRATGIQIGAYGFVEKLIPQVVETGERQQSQGFIHTPSLNHARTAAVLKAGWSAYKEEANNEAFAVNLSSERSRLASWLFDAVRQGQDLGDALGYLFERSIHDNRETRDYWIHPVRKAVLKHTQQDADPRCPVVDGLELTALWNGGQGKRTIETLTREYFNGPAPNMSELIPFLEKLESAADAMADAAIADSVHALVQGNPLRAGSSLAAISRGDNPPPDLHVLNTSRKGMTLTHRAMILGPAGTDSLGWFETETVHAANPRAAVSRDLDDIVSKLLGKMKDIQFTVGYRNGDGAISNERSFRLSELNSSNSFDASISALDLLSLLPEGDDYAFCPLENWIAHHLHNERSETISSELVPCIIWDEPSSQTMLWLQSWREVVFRSRSLNPRDLTYREAETEEDEELFDISSLEADLERMKCNLEALLEELDKALFVRSPEYPVPFSDSELPWAESLLRRAARYNLWEAIPPVLPEEERSGAYIGALHSARSVLQKRLAGAGLPNDSGEDQEARAEAVKVAIRAVFGKQLPIGVALKPSNHPETIASFRRSSDRLKKNPYQPYEWLEKMQYVKPALRSFSEALMVHDVSDRPSGSIDFTVAQWPDYANEPWVALNPPIDRELGRFSILAALPEGISPESIYQESTLVTGLLIDEVVERLPSTQEDTGVAMHIDAPNTEPPQTLLLAMAPEGKKWDFDLMRDTLKETLQWSRLRGIDGEHIDYLDHHLPAVFAGKNLR